MSNINFPCFMENQYTSEVVKFYSLTEGVLVRLGHNHKSGFVIKEGLSEFVSCDKPSHWTPFEESKLSYQPTYTYDM